MTKPSVSKESLPHTSLGLRLVDVPIGSGVVGRYSCTDGELVSSGKAHMFSLMSPLTPGGSNEGDYGVRLNDKTRVRVKVTCVYG